MVLSLNIPWRTLTTQETTAGNKFLFLNMAIFVCKGTECMQLSNQLPHRNTKTFKSFYFLLNHKRAFADHS